MGAQEVQQPVSVTEVRGQGVAEVIVLSELGEDRDEASEAAVIEVAITWDVVTAPTLALCPPLYRPSPLLNPVLRHKRVENKEEELWPEPSHDSV